MFVRLDLPEFDYKIKKQDNNYYIFDVIRKKYVRLFVEEWVRQHFIHFLLQKKYPKSLMCIETGHTSNTMSKRTDIIVRNTKGEPLVLVECKATSSPINEQVFRQLSIYNLDIKAPLVAMTNGHTHHYFSYDKKKNTYCRLKLLPEYSKY